MARIDSTHETTRPQQCRPRNPWLATGHVSARRTFEWRRRPNSVPFDGSTTHGRKLGTVMIIQYYYEHAGRSLTASPLRNTY